MPAAGVPLPPARRHGPGAAVVNHGGVIGVIMVWALAPTTRSLRIGSQLRGAGVSHGTCQDGFAMGWARPGGWSVGIPLGGDWGWNLAEEHPGHIPRWRYERDMPRGGSAWVVGAF